LQDRNFPKRPANPNRKTAIWICTSPLFNMAEPKFNNYLVSCRYFIRAG
jgi:hypothetical protein